jgi:hypothetical protein
VNPLATPLFQLWLLEVDTRGPLHKLPLATPKADLEKIIRKGKALHGGTSTTEPGISDDFQYPPIGTPIYASHSTVIPSAGVS